MNLKAYKFDFILWLCNRLIAYVPSGRMRLFFYRRVMRFKFDPKANLLSGTWCDCLGNVSIGKNSVINQNCRLDNRGGLMIGENVSISPEVHLITADHDIQSEDFHGRKAQITINERVFIGSRATVLPGVTIHEGAVVAACACVTKDVPPHTIVGAYRPASSVSATKV